MSWEIVSKSFGKLFEVWEFFTKFGNIVLIVWNSKQDSWSHGHHQEQWARSSETVSKNIWKVIWTVRTFDQIWKYAAHCLTQWASLMVIRNSQQTHQKHWAEHLKGCLKCGNFCLHMEICCSLSDTVSNALSHHQKHWARSLNTIRNSE